MLTGPSTTAEAEAVSFLIKFFISNQINQIKSCISLNSLSLPSLTGTATEYYIILSIILFTSDTLLLIFQVKVADFSLRLTDFLHLKTEKEEAAVKIRVKRNSIGTETKIAVC